MYPGHKEYEARHKFKVACCTPTFKEKVPDYEELTDDPESTKKTPIMTQTITNLMRNLISIILENSIRRQRTPAWLWMIWTY